MTINCERCKQNKKHHYLGEAQIKIRRHEFYEKYRNVFNKFKKEYGLGLNYSIVGSAKRKLVVVKDHRDNINSKWDIDLQIIIHSSSIERLSKEMSIEDSNFESWLKNKLMELFEEKFKDYNIEDSTSVITLKHKDLTDDNFSGFDIAILKRDGDNNLQYIIKNDQDGSTHNWSDSSLKFVPNRTINWKDNANEIRQKYLNKKCENDYNSNFNKEDINHKPSASLFIEVINEIG